MKKAQVKPRWSEYGSGIGFQCCAQKFQKNIIQLTTLWRTASHDRTTSSAQNLLR